MSVSDVHGMLGPAAMAVTAPFLGSFILLAIKNKRFASISSLIATSDRPTAAAVPFIFCPIVLTLCMIWLFIVGVTEVTARPAALGLVGTCGAAFAVAIALAFNIRQYWWTHKFAVVLLVTSAFALLAGLHWKTVLLLAHLSAPGVSPQFTFWGALDFGAAARALAPPPLPEGAVIHLALVLIIMLEVSIAVYVLSYAAAAVVTGGKPQQTQAIPIAEGALEMWAPLCLALIIWALTPVLTAHANDVHGHLPFSQLLAQGAQGLASTPSLQQQLLHEHALVRGSAHIVSGMRELWWGLIQLAGTPGLAG